jgi:hypothetical protein
VVEQTNGHTNTRTKYCNPCCACAPRVKNKLPTSKYY